MLCTYVLDAIAAGSLMIQAPPPSHTHFVFHSPRSTPYVLLCSIMTSCNPGVSQAPYFMPHCNFSCVQKGKKNIICWENSSEVLLERGLGGRHLYKLDVRGESDQRPQRKQGKPQRSGNCPVTTPWDKPLSLLANSHNNATFSAQS